MRKRLDPMIVSAGHRLIIHQRVHHRFFSCLDDSVENWIHQIVRDRLHRMSDLIWRPNIFVRGRKRDEQIPRAVSGNCSGAGKAKRNAAREPFQLIRQKRRIRRDDGNARTGVLAVNCPGNFFSNRHARNRQQPASSKICLNKNANGKTLRRFIFSGFDVDLARGGSISAFEFITDHAGAAANAPLLDRAAVRGIERVKNAFRFHMKPVGVVEPTIPRLGDER